MKVNLFSHSIISISRNKARDACLPAALAHDEAMTGDLRD